MMHKENSTIREIRYSEVNSWEATISSRKDKPTAFNMKQRLQRLEEKYLKKKEKKKNL